MSYYYSSQSHYKNRDRTKRTNCEDNTVPYYENVLKSHTGECDEKQKHSHPDECLDAILCNQSCMCSCETELFCEATSRISYELNKAKNLCEVKQIVEIISCLFSASAERERALAEIIKAYCGKEKYCCKNNKTDC